MLEVIFERQQTRWLSMIKLKMVGVKWNASRKNAPGHMCGGAVGLPLLIYNRLSSSPAVHTWSLIFFAHTSCLSPMAAPHQPAHGLPLGPQPNIPVLEQSFHNAGVELGRLANIPALAQGDAIINRLDQMQNQMGQHGQLLQQQGQQLQQQGQQLQQIVQMQQRMFQAQQQMQRQMDQNFANVRTTQRAR